MPILYECDICGGYHRWTFNGECRDNTERFADPDDYNRRRRVDEQPVTDEYGPDVATMDERVEADRD